MRLLAVTIVLAAGCSAEPPRFDDVRTAWQPSESYLLDRRGELIATRRLDFAVRRTSWTPVEDISSPLIAATIAAEDRRFYRHAGVDWRALAAAAVARARGESRRGASTITMQVAARLDPDLSPAGTSRSPLQKFEQIAAALALERQWRKDEVLEAYLNGVDFRGELAGIAAATRGLLGKSPSGVDEAEAAVLAALVRAPNADVEVLARRACRVAVQAEFAVSCDEIRDVAQAVVRTAGRAATSRPDDAPEIARVLLREPGRSVVTTLDARVQRLVRSALLEQLEGLTSRNVRDGAALVLDNESGDVLAWVGSAGRRSQAPEVDGVRALRQAGSTLKPFLYALLLERRYLTAASLLDDSPIALESAGGLYVPRNYDQVYKGAVSVRAALAESLNVPAVRALTLLGVEPFRDRLRSLGYESLVESADFYGFSLALGSADVTLLAQANAYRTLANGGRFGPVRLVPGDAPDPGRQVLDPRAAFIVTDILADRASRARAFGLASVLGTRQWSAAKTGTSKDMRDNWCIGFSSRHTVAVWVGNFEGDPMHDVSGVSGAAPAWLTIMNALSGEALPRPSPPPGVVAQVVTFEDDLEASRSEWFIAGTELARIERADVRRQGRIVRPTHGAILAIDPDIPAANQRVAFAADAPEDAAWRLDGATAPLGRDGWLPTPGRHVLQLVAGDRTLDEVVFRVRAPLSR
jgi:penicillin-binding protein 1C